MIPGVTLRLPYLIFSRPHSGLRRLHRSTSVNDSELLVRRHEIAVPRRTNPTPHLHRANPAQFATHIRHLPRSRAATACSPRSPFCGRIAA
jgi:hypothetical protein